MFTLSFVAPKGRILQEADERKLYKKIGTLVDYFVQEMSKVGNPGLQSIPQNTRLNHLSREIKATQAWWLFNPRSLDSSTPYFNWYIRITPQKQWGYVASCLCFKEADINKRGGADEFPYYWTLSSTKFKRLAIAGLGQYQNSLYVANGLILYDMQEATHQDAYNAAEELATATLRRHNAGVYSK